MRPDELDDFDARFSMMRYHFDEATCATRLSPIPAERHFHFYAFHGAGISAHERFAMSASHACSPRKPILACAPIWPAHFSSDDTAG